MMTKQQDIFILGTAYSGSTLLGRFLDSYKEITYLGEINRLEGFGPPKKYEWEVNERCFYCGIKNRECPVWTYETIRKFKKRGELKIFDTARRLFNTPIIVDGSKFLDWLRHLVFHGYSLEKTKVIVSVKNPFATVYSIVKRKFFQVFEAANTWRDTYYDIYRTLNMLGINFIIVKYEDFYFKYEKTAKRIADFLSLDHIPTPEEFLSHPLHSLGGNVSAMIKGDKELKTEQIEQQKGINKQIMLGFNFTPEYMKAPWGTFEDLRWTKTLKEEDINIILTTPDLIDIAALYGYDIGELLKKYYKHNRS